MNIVEQIEQLQNESDRAHEVANALYNANLKQIERLLTEHTAQHRKYPDGYAFSYQGKPCTIGRAWSYYYDGGIVTLYAVLQNGHEIDTLMEKNVDNPDYA